MGDKIYFHLLILYGIWCCGIIGTFADEEINESSDFLVRHKRVISHVPNEDRVLTIKQAPHVVIIRYLLVIHCVGSILSTSIVITAAHCVPLGPDQYTMISSTSRSNRGTHHGITDIRRNLHIALLSVHPPFVYSIYCRKVDLHVSPLLSGTVGQVGGWGYIGRGNERGTQHPLYLRSIEIPIISHWDCVYRYRPRFAITDKEVCTYHRQRHCGHTDFGAGLIVDGYLAGVFIWSGLNQTGIDPEYPEVFAMVQHFDYNHWIRLNVPDVGIQGQNGRHP